MTPSRTIAALKPFIIRNHLFVWTADTYVPLRQIPAEYQLLFPYDISGLTDATLDDLEIDRASLMRRQMAGDLFGIVLREGRVVYRILVQTRGTAQMEGDRYAFRLGADQGYIHSSFTAAAHRGKNLHAAMMRKVGQRYAADNLFVACRQSNVPGAMAIQRAGFRYLKSDVVAGIANGRIRLRYWYRDEKMTRPPPLERPTMSPTST
jgi:hypothetical protein